MCPPPRDMVAEAIENLVLLGLHDAVCVERRADDHPFDILARCDHFDLLQERHERTIGKNRVLQFLVDGGALLGIGFEDGAAGLCRQRSRIPGIAPCERLRLRGVRIVIIGRERIGVGIRVLIIRSPFTDIKVVLAGAILGEGLLAVARNELDLDSGLRPLSAGSPGRCR